MTGIASPDNPPLENSAPITNGNDDALNGVRASTTMSGIAGEAVPDRFSPVDAPETNGTVKSEAPQTPEPAAESRTNRHGDDTDELAVDGHPSTGEPPAKRRRVNDTTPHTTPRKKPESPPWKRVLAEGPSSFTENGVRKSGRINTVPIELQRGDKRITRRSLHAQESSIAGRTRHAATNTQPSASQTVKRPASSGKAAPAKSEPETIKPRACTPSSEFCDYIYKQAKLKPKLGPSFEEYFVRAADIPVEDGGQLILEDDPRIDDETAQNEAEIILRIEEEVQPGGLLTEPQCSVFEPEPAEEPPRQWAHTDHLVKAMTNFRKLMVMEQQRHRATAKKIAEACREVWRKRQPKTAQELEEEARKLWEGKYRLVVRAMFGTWDNVKTEINRRRLEEWEAAEQKRVKAALQEAVNLSEQKLLARQAQADSDAMSVDDEDLDDALSDLDNDADTSGADGDSAEASEEDEDDNMTSSSDDEDDDDAESAASDEGLTQEQLREKYAKLESPHPEGDNVVGGQVTETQAREERGGPGSDSNETSDESIDMDDDLGSTDMDSDDDGASDGDGEESDEEGEADDQPSGLLGLLFGKDELKKMADEAATKEVDPNATADGTQTADAESPTQTSALVNGSRKEEGPDEKSHGAEVERRTVSKQDTSAPAPSAEGMVNGYGTAPSPREYDGLPHAAGLPTPAPAQDSNGPPAKHALGPMVNGADSAPTVEENIAKATLRVRKANPTSRDVLMEDAAPVEAATVPEVEVTAPHSEAKQTSPETDAVTNLASPDRSQSPRTLDTKPSDVDTVSSLELLNAPTPMEVSRATSPQSTAPKTEVPFLLRGTLREYQHYGLDWLAGLYANNTNGILADEMGLGKTIQTIALLAHLACQHEVWGPHLVIVPTSVMLNWEMEFKKWCPGFKILTYYGNQEERKRKRQGWTNDDVWNVCITSYQIVLQDQQVFKRRRWHYMILDEAHNIKNFRSQRWQTLLGFNTHSRLLLTGTPLQNNLTELWSLLFFLMPSENGVGGFADLREFHDWFHKPESQILESGREQMDDEARAIISKLHKVLRPYLLRRLKADVEKQMPAKHEHVEFCRLSKRQRELYDGFLARTETRETLSSGNYLSIINCLMQLRKVCNHPDLFIDRPIMTSFRMEKSVPAGYETTAQLVCRRLLPTNPMGKVSLGFLNLVPTEHESLSHTLADRISQLSSHRILMDLRATQKARTDAVSHALDPATVESNLFYLESAARWGRFEELQHCVYVNALRRQQRPIYGQRLRDFLTIGTDKRPYKAKPRVPREVMKWFEDDSFILRTMVPTLSQRATSMEGVISKFACVTPAVVTRDLERILLGDRGVEAFEDANLRLSAPVKRLPFMPREPPVDPWHEARMRLSIQFPDKRLLQYDCGKLQALDKLLRKLQAGGHRALIFTQMTKVLDILEQFLNIHGHKYLRLDGSTKVEQRQILTDRFNVDTRILCFILSTRSGGLGLNLTGADTVIFYDQDWNPAMDKQCQDRCHRIGQTRDVHIYRLVSEHTIEANILRKASQKQMLDDVVIQEGEFTTDYFNKLSVHDVIGDADKGGLLGENDAAANAAMDRILGGVETTDQKTATRVLEQAEDTEDVAAARAAERENQQDDADFLEKPGGGTGSGVSSVRQSTPREGSAAPATLGKSGLGLFAESVEPAVEVVEEIEHNAWGERVHNIDDYMLKVMAAQLEGTALELPKDKKKSKKKGKDTRRR
ncbi:Helicase SWR1 [Pleurostoma richardsiae]|uniref:DNA helicase n=1 Tax=Pleurostoma richardsiae TaxID=41990 RepID=A0AA38RUC2_9PEZI|nr:Helicase SWR1 [Pleurostoma richardsiae]